MNSTAALLAVARLGIVPSLDGIKREAVNSGDFGAVAAILRREVLREFADASCRGAYQDADSCVWMQPLEAMTH